MISRLFYTLTTLFIRLSIALFLIRICVKRMMKVIIYATMAGVTAFSIFYFFLALFQCSPIDYFWNRKKPPAAEYIDHCMWPWPQLSRLHCKKQSLMAVV